MSIIIKTMVKMPEHCYDCPCHDGESGYCQADKEHRYSDYRPFWCPLTEISDDTSERVENIEKQMKEDKEEQLKKLEAELDYAKFRCALPTIMDMMCQQSKKIILKFFKKVFTNNLIYDKI